MGKTPQPPGDYRSTEPTAGKPVANRKSKIENPMNNLKFAFRQLLKNPGFTVVAVLILALGIGATTSLFSVVYGVLISPYPYAKPGEIWMPGLTSAQANQLMRPYRQDEYLEMTKLPAFSEVMATRPG